MKHPGHIRHFGHVPLVEGLVEGGCVLKHKTHPRHIGHVPIVERLLGGVLLRGIELVELRLEVGGRHGLRDEAVEGTV